ncbi:MAG TPA: PD-(D/E)XK nuclease family protein [Tepidisphaeraceae bacterium]|nr:PD-(D/E)XK nuclease family protein [Tepidisphaeraceae bacterium]
MINLIYDAEEARIEGIEEAVSLLPGGNPATDLLRRIVTHECRLGDRNTFEPLLRGVQKIVQANRVERSITDWPFENFWENPKEPRHTKLLGYFLDANSGHGCADMLVQSFLQALDLEISFDGYRIAVECEKCVERRENKDGRIDLLITCTPETAGPKYAIIIENKVNQDDQQGQLSDYVRSLTTDRFKPPFKPEEIIAVYLPLNESRQLSEQDRHGIKQLGASLKERTFDKHVRNWLRTMVHTWPKDIRIAGMRDNLQHYLNLLNYRMNREKEQKMRDEIFAAAIRARDQDKLPTYAQARELETSARELSYACKALAWIDLQDKVKRKLKDSSVDARLSYINRNGEDIEIDHGLGENIDTYRRIKVELGENTILVAEAGPADEGTYIGYRCASGSLDERLTKLFSKKSSIKGGGGSGWYVTERLKFEPDRIDEEAKTITERFLKLRKEAEAIINNPAKDR